jgi:crotonobetainyl-CoA:carnitine CoA-transferase CaiB-like acyl-CoA transferase
MAVDLPFASRRLAYPPHYGEHTHAVLAEAGYGGDEIARFERDGIIAAAHREPTARATTA